MENLRYKKLAYSVIRDAIGFYFGIQKFLETCNQTREEAFNLKLQHRIQSYQKRCGTYPPEDIITEYKDDVDNYLDKRLEFLKSDLDHCKSVLFTNNEWLQWLNVDPDFLSKYLNALDERAREELRVVPTWILNDEFLGLPYIKSDKTKA